ncbi:hypothetical protein [Cerasicoccus fimbriatus]|uniref:hypothetical protein n=1 Tax=Cerasicoccus fimbriatus TaxID=3014554 RepID=UPI0022B4AECE|nr:hypothetical protein [Cerasicoccus sp. TK19100]
MKHLEHLAVNVVEIEGVDGLFVMDSKGTTIAAMMPEFYDGVDWNILRRRVHALVQTFSEAAMDAKETILDFGDKILQISCSPTCTVGVVADSSANFKGMQIATRLLMKKVKASDIVEMEAAAETDDSDDSVKARLIKGMSRPENNQPRKPKTRPPMAVPTSSKTPFPLPSDEDTPPPQVIQPKIDTKKKEKKSSEKYKGIWG